MQSTFEINMGEKTRRKLKRFSTKALKSYVKDALLTNFAGFKNNTDYIAWDLMCSELSRRGVNIETFIHVYTIKD